MDYSHLIKLLQPSVALVIIILLILLKFWRQIKEIASDVFDLFLYLRIRFRCWRLNLKLRKGRQFVKDDKVFRDLLKDIYAMVITPERDENVKPYVEDEKVICPVYYKLFRAETVIKAVREGIPLAYIPSDCGFKILQVNDETLSRKSLELCLLEKIIIDGKLGKAYERAFQQQKDEEFRIEGVACIYAAIEKLYEEWEGLKGELALIFMKELSKRLLL